MLSGDDLQKYSEYALFSIFHCGIPRLVHYDIRCRVAARDMPISWDGDWFRPYGPMRITSERAAAALWRIDPVSQLGCSKRQIVRYRGKAVTLAHPPRHGFAE
jgi:hypothetical protein